MIITNAMMQLAQTTPTRGGYTTKQQAYGKALTGVDGQGWARAMVGMDVTAAEWNQFWNLGAGNRAKHYKKAGILPPANPSTIYDKRKTKDDIDYKSLVAGLQKEISRLIAQNEELKKKLYAFQNPTYLRRNDCL